MIRAFIFTAIFLVASVVVFGQKYKTNKSKIIFFSEAPMEDIEAYNTNTVGFFNLANSKIAFSVPIKSFEFEKKLMKKHFNENYMESEQYTRARFKGKLIGFEEKMGVQKLTAEGIMEIHGMEQEVRISGESEIKNGKIYMSTSFPIQLKDYGIKIPKILFQSIAEKVDVTATFEFEKDQQD